MGLLNRLLALFTVTSGRVDDLQPPGAPPPAATPARDQYTADMGHGIQLTVSVSMPGRPDVAVSEDDVTRAMEPYRFVLGTQLSALKTADQWWNEEIHKRRLKEGSAKAMQWLEPFVGLKLAESLQLKAASNQWGPLGANALAKELRAIVKERRKANEPHEDILQALYGACLLEGFVKTLTFDFIQPHAMACLLSVEEVRSTQLDYSTIGYQHVPTLGKTDVKWLVATFGEPASHRYPDDVFAVLRRAAICRYCWTELNRENETFRARAPMAMEAWLRKRFESSVRIEKENEAIRASRVVRQERNEQAIRDLSKAWAATDGTFVVADLETTGLSADTDDILKFGAVRVDASGNVVAEFSALVNVGKALPPLITRLTGIHNDEVASRGKPLSHAFGAFVGFLEQEPVFFHNAGFDERFLAKASEKVGRKFSAPVYDTMWMAQSVWSDLDSLKLKDLTAHVGAPPPSHRALADAKAALAVLNAAKRAARSLT